MRAAFQVKAKGVICALAQPMTSVSAAAQIRSRDRIGPGLTPQRICHIHPKSYASSVAMELPLPKIGRAFQHHA